MEQLVAGVRRAVQATRDMNLETRQAAEAQFEQLSIKEYPKLVYALGEIMKDNAAAAVDDPVRQQAGVLMQGFIKPRAPEKRAQYAQLWMEQSAAFKVQVKQQLVAVMGLPGPAGSGLSRSAASCLAEIAILEVPKKAWQGFSEQMKSLCQRQEPDDAAVALRKNACILLGQVCDKLQPGVHFSQEEVNTILGSICACMISKSPDVIGAAMDALTKSLKFIAANMQDPAHRTHVMNELIGKGIQSSSALVQEKALQCLVCICDDYYQYMNEFMSKVLPLTVQIVKAPAATDEVKIQAIEVWNTLLEVELDLVNGNHNFMRKSGLQLVPIIMQTMVFRTKEMAESEDNAPERSARITLQLLSTLMKSTDMLHAVMQIVGPCITQPVDRWNQREMGFIAMGLVMEVGDDPAVAVAIKPFVEKCVKEIVSSSTKAGEALVTRDSALWALDRVFVFALNQFPDPNFAMKTLEHVLKIIKGVPDSQSQLIVRAVSCVSSYHKFFKHCPNTDARAVLVEKFCPVAVHTGVLKSMVEASEARQKVLCDNNLGSTIFDCIQEVVQVPGQVYSAQTAEKLKGYYRTIHSIYTSFIVKLEAVLQNQSLSTEVRNLYVAGYCSSLNSCLLAFDQDAYRPAIQQQSLPQTERLLKNCFQIQVLANAGAIQEESLMVTTRIISIMGDKATKYVPSVMSNMKRIIDAKAGDDETKLAIGLISEVYGSGWQTTTEHHDTVMQLLLTLMSDGTLSRETKPLILEAMCSMLAFLQKDFMKYMAPVNSILMGAMQVPKPPNQDTEENQDTCTFVDKLRSEILILLSELMQVPEAAASLQDQAFLRALGTFCLIVGRDQDQTDEHDALLRGLLDDMTKKQQVTAVVASKLAQQPEMQKYFSQPGGF